ncbi:hypothetical protein N9L92_04470 [Saprospiraceae bacterium]|nr:hypothetical protein [Saprospiraceae bacterium]
MKNNSRFIQFLSPLVIYIILISPANAQINWNEFREPDGILQRLTIDPRITFISNNSDFNNTDSKSFRGQMLTRYSINKVQEKSIAGLNISHNLIYNNQSDVNESTNSTENEIQIIGTYTQYLSERRGFFLRGQPNFRYEYNSDFNTSHIYQLAGRFMIGYGRLENVSTVYQAIRIDKNLYGNEGIDQEKLYALASTLREIDFNNALDTRMRTVENQAEYLQTLEEYGYDVSSYINIANAIDMFRFERPNIVQHGHELAIGLLPSISNTSSNTVLPIITGTYAKAISDIWHWNVSVEIAPDLFSNNDRGFASIFNTISYIPTARTQISFNQVYQHRSFDEFLNLRLNASYFVSPQLNLFFSTRFTLSETDFISNSNSFSHDMGLKYFFF